MSAETPTPDPSQPGAPLYRRLHDLPPTESPPEPPFETTGELNTEAEVEAATVATEGLWGRIRARLHPSSDAVIQESANATIGGSLPDIGLEPSTRRERRKAYKASRLGNRLVEETSKQIHYDSYSNTDATGRVIDREQPDTPRRMSRGQRKAQRKNAKLQEKSEEKTSKLRRKLFGQASDDVKTPLDKRLDAAEERRRDEERRDNFLTQYVAHKQGEADWPADRETILKVLNSGTDELQKVKEKEVERNALRNGEHLSPSEIKRRAAAMVTQSIQEVSYRDAVEVLLQKEGITGGLTAFKGSGPVNQLTDRALDHLVKLGEKGKLTYDKKAGYFDQPTRHMNVSKAEMDAIEAGATPKKRDYGRVTKRPHLGWSRADESVRQVFEPSGQEHDYEPHQTPRTAIALEVARQLGDLNEGSDAEQSSGLTIVEYPKKKSGR